MRRIPVPAVAAMAFIAVYQLAPAAGPAPAESGEESDVYYPGCNSVRAAGEAPLYRGEPGYRPEMDGDDDGIACEPRPGD